MFKRIIMIVILSVATLNTVIAEENFYQKKNISFVVGFPPGSGYDIYARIVAKHIGKHIPGNPTTIVQNMPGAGSNTAGSYVTEIAEKDGTVIGAVSMGNLTASLFRQTNQRYNPSLLNYIGSPNTDYNVCIVHKDSPVQDFKEIASKEIIFGASSAGNESKDWTVMMKNMLGNNIKIVSGYDGSVAILLAMKNKEVHGMCGQSYSFMESRYQTEIKDGIFRYLLQQDDENGQKELTRRGVPQLTSFAKNEEQKKVMEIIFSQKSFSRPLFVAKEVPKDRVEILKKAFVETMQDPELIEETKKMNLDIDFRTGSDVEKTVKEMFSLSKDTLSIIRKYFEE